MNTSSTAITPQTIRDVMRFWSTGVTVVSAAFDGQQHGMTVNSFTSVSLEPPLVLVSLERTTRTHDLVEGSKAFAVTLLTQAQQEVSDLFAGRHSEDSDRFDGLETFTLESGSPFLKEGLAFLDCQVVARYRAGTHTLFIGQVIATHAAPDAESLPPLTYFNRQYRQLEK
jgi:flavin reductase (DIM6/NTAB) family NADH-FMN oxidoreductase RutF